jgi:hypothetical protein
MVAFRIILRRSGRTISVTAVDTLNDIDRGYVTQMHCSASRLCDVNAGTAGWDFAVIDESAPTRPRSRIAVGRPISAFGPPYP